jgi:hypothetical protein
VPASRTEEPPKGLERLSLLIMDDTVEANHRAADEAGREMHRPDAVASATDRDRRA